MHPETEYTHRETSGTSAFDSKFDAVWSVHPTYRQLPSSRDAAEWKLEAYESMQPRKAAMHEPSS